MPNFLAAALLPFIAIAAFGGAAVAAAVPPGASQPAGAANAQPSAPAETVAAAIPATGGTAILLEAADIGATTTNSFAGSIQWHAGTAPNGSPTLVGEASMPARDLRLRLVVGAGENAEAGTSELMRIDFAPGPGFPGRQIALLPGVFAKDQAPLQGSPFAGTAERVAPDSFVFAFGNSTGEVAANTGLLASSRWIDIAVVYATGVKALVSLDTGGAGGLFAKVVGSGRSASP